MWPLTQEIPGHKTTSAGKREPGFRIHRETVHPDRNYRHFLF